MPGGLIAVGCVVGWARRRGEDLEERVGIDGLDELMVEGVGMGLPGKLNLTEG